MAESQAQIGQVAPFEAAAPIWNSEFLEASPASHRLMDVPPARKLPLC